MQKRYSRMTAYLAPPPSALPCFTFMEKLEAGTLPCPQLLAIDHAPFSGAIYRRARGAR
jgi:hypothetical protein